MQEQDEEEVCRHILLRPGAFTTPRAAYRTIRYSKRKTTQRIFEEIVTKFEGEGLGKYVKFPKGESAYYKPLPLEKNRAAL